MHFLNQESWGWLYSSGWISQTYTSWVDPSISPIHIEHPSITASSFRWQRLLWYEGAQSSHCFRSQVITYHGVTCFTTLFCTQNHEFFLENVTKIYFLFELPPQTKKEEVIVSVLNKCPCALFAWLDTQGQPSTLLMSIMTQGVSWLKELYLCLQMTLQRS